jgi:hypothetical protein
MEKNALDFPFVMHELNIHVEQYLLPYPLIAVMNKMQIFLYLSARGAIHVISWLELATTA